jgi:hypothetical protein
MHDPNLKYIPGTTMPLKFIYEGIVRKGCPVVANVKGRVGEDMIHTIEWIRRRPHPACSALLAAAGVNENTYAYEGEPQQDLALCSADWFGTWRYSQCQDGAGVLCLGGCGRKLVGTAAFVQCSECRTGGADSRFVSGEGGSLRQAHLAARHAVHKHVMGEGQLRL